MVRTRTAGKILRELQLGTATGIDQLPVRWFKECADVLAVGAMLARKVVTDGKRPPCWKMHSVVPLHKRGSVFDKLNYRGAHLTTIPSKVVERCGSHGVPFPRSDVGVWSLAMRISKRDGSQRYAQLPHCHLASAGRYFWSLQQGFK